MEEIPEMAPIMQAAKTQMGFYPTMFDHGSTSCHAQGLFAFYAKYIGAGQIDPVLKRLLGIISSSTTGCQYCTAHATHQAHIRSETDAKIAAVWEFEQSDLFSEAEKQALRFAMHAAMVPNAVSDEMMQN